MLSHLYDKILSRHLINFSRKHACNIRLCSQVTWKDHIRPVESDEDFGVTAFLSFHRGFSGVLRHRCSDFLVHEISIDKEVVRLTNLGICEKTVLDFFKLTQCLRKDAKNVLMTILEGKIVKECEINVSALHDKEIEDLCQILRKLGFNLEVYKKLTDLGLTIVLNSRSHKTDTYTNFVLYKENIASLDSLQIIANMLKVKFGGMAVAGMKDKRAITCQRVTAKNVTVEKLITLNEKLRGMKIGNIYYDTKPLLYGGIYGNRFTILIRELDSNTGTIKEAVDNLCSKGFINYYGLQRFGKTDIPMQAIGKKLLCRDWQSSVEMIIKPSNHQVTEDVLKSRELWWETRDSSAALNCLNAKNSRLGLLLRGLVANSNNFERALEWIPFRVIKLYLHSYCSYVWNVIVSRRITELGASPVLGDLVIRKDDSLRLTEKHLWPVYLVDKEILKENEIDMYNVVLPLPGYNMKLPQNVVGSWYTEVLEKDGLSILSFQSENPRYAIKPSYRYVLAKPENMEWSILNYDNPDADLLDCDYVKMLGAKEPAEKTGSRRALKLEFSLKSSSYATSALRELMQTCITKLS